ncbi:MAG TPA: hypothetical protein VH720_14550 [Candidatus Limnocylindrales bacterium]|jgi:hypothetical protein
MGSVAVRILHVRPRSDAGPLTCLLADARRRLALRHLAAFNALGAGDGRLVERPADDTPFGVRVRDLAPRAGGLVLLGSGAIPLARAVDLRPFLATAAVDDRVAIANNRYSADIVAVGRAVVLRSLPELPSDNALPRWLDEVAGYHVRDLARRWRLQVDWDSPLDLLLTAASAEPIAADAPAAAVTRRIAVTAANRRAEVVVAGRTSASSLRWLERNVAARVRALVEERGLRASSQAAMSSRDRAAHRPPRSVLGLVLDRDGPEALGSVLAGLGDAAIVDSRVLLAHRHGADERAWPSQEDRYASDLLLPDAIRDPWLRALTASAAGARIPILLGGHTVVGPGVRLVIRPRWT